MPEVSTATIRNELASLEDMGYLIQPHISSGRVPSVQAYKLYVEKLMAAKPLEEEDISKIRGKFDNQFTSFEEVVKVAAQVISDKTNYTSVVAIDRGDDLRIKKIKLVPLTNDTALVIILTDKIVISDKIIRVDEGLEGGYLESASEILNRVFEEKTLAEIGTLETIINDELDSYKALFVSIFNIIENHTKKRHIEVEGEMKVLDYVPESTTSAKKFLQVIKHKETLNNLISANSDIEFSVKIGNEAAEGLDGGAVVSAKYSVNGKEIGRAGVIGPVRMDYGKVFSVLNLVCKMLDEILK
jgi:heat-inducible transcriptional repressor